MKRTIQHHLKTAILLLILTITSSNTYAQGFDYQAVKAKADTAAQDLTDKLELDENQQEKVQSILFETMAKEQALADHLKRMEEMLKEQVKIAADEKQAKIKALLTDKQLKLLKKEQKKVAQQ